MLIFFLLPSFLPFSSLNIIPLLIFSSFTKYSFKYLSSWARNFFKLAVVSSEGRILLILLIKRLCINLLCFLSLYSFIFGIICWFVRCFSFFSFSIVNAFDDSKQVFTELRSLCVRLISYFFPDFTDLDTFGVLELSLNTYTYYEHITPIDRSLAINFFLLLKHNYSNTYFIFYFFNYSPF